MPSDNRSQRPSSSGWPGSAGSFSSRGNFRPRARPNTSAEQSHGSQLPNNSQPFSSTYRGSGQRYYGANAPYSREPYKSNRSRTGSYYSSRDGGYSADPVQADASSATAQNAPGNRYHSRNSFSNQNSSSHYYQPRYTSRNDQRVDQRPRFSNSSSYYGSGSRQNSLNSSAKEDFYDNSHSYSPNNFRDDNRRSSSYASTLYSKRTDRSDDSSGAYRFQRTSRPSLIPKDFKDDYNDEEDEDMERQLNNLKKEDSEPLDEAEIKNDVAASTINKEETEAKESAESQNVSDNGVDDDIEQNTDVHQKLQNNSPKQNTSDEVFKTGIVPRVLSKESSQEKDDESDNYDPEINISDADDIKKAIEEVDISPKKINSEKEFVQDINPQLNGNLPSSLKEVKLFIPKKRQIIVPLEAPDSDIFPLPRLEDKLWELKNHPKKERTSQLPYLLKKSIKSVEDYPFYSRNFLVHEQVIKPKLLKNLSIIKTNTFLAKASLVNEYQQRALDWEDRLNEMNQQLDSIYPHRVSDQDSKEEEAPAEKQIITESTRASTSRRGRGDAVQSEAEFLEILKSLGAEEENEPLRRAEHLAAPIPDMILNPTTKNMFLTNVNNLVDDKEEWATSIKVDGVDNFSRREHELFCEAFLSYPKRFGRISAFMGGLRTAEECVLHYYRTKKTLTDYKQLLALKKKRRKGPKGKRGPKPKSTGTVPGTPTLDTPKDSGDELSLDSLIPKEVTEEVYYTETGRRRRAAAPVFETTDSENGRSTPAVPNVETERKRSLEAPTSVDQAPEEVKEPNQDITIANPVKKKQRGPKPKKPVDASAIPSVETESIDPSSSSGETKSKGNITSYWSVRDTNLFTNLLGEYGQNWMVIAENIKTKSAVMVKNYYHRNADHYGWKKIVEVAEARLQSENQDYVAPKNPPLGVFTASTNVPSNINVTYNATAPSPSPPLPSQQPLHPLPTILPSVNQVANQLPPTSTFQPAPPSLPILVAPKDPISRPNLFSITSLLNPSEERKFQERTTNKVPYNSINGNSNGVKVEMTYDSVRQIKQPVGFNPLNALIDAAQNSPGWNNIQQPQSYETAGTKSFDSVRPVYGRDTPNYTGGYQAAYSESSIRGGRSILNDDTSTDPNPALPSISSNLKNILINDTSSANNNGTNEAKDS